MAREPDVTTVTLQTGRLLLRAFCPEDLQDLYAFASEEGVGEMAGWKRHETPEDSRAVLDCFLQGKNVFAVVLRETGRVIGSFGLYPSWARSDPEYSGLSLCELGFSLSRRYWGQGLMTEACREVIRFCFGQGYDALTCGHFTENVQSRRVIEKCGFSFVRDEVLYMESIRRVCRTQNYLLLREDWEKQNKECI